jgi:PAS domain S-box-containing protein
VEAFSSDGERLAQESMPSALARQGKFVRNLEICLRLKESGSTTHCEVSTAPIEINKDEPSQILIALRDVTESSRTREAQARLAAIVASSEDAIIGKDLRGVVTSWNVGAEKIFGYTAGEMIGQPILRLLPPGREHEEEDILGRIRRGETVEHYETQRAKKNGQVIHVSLTISPIRNARGAITGASKIARDITDKKMMERQLHQSQKMEAVGQLTGGVAHDFNNLLGAIMGNLDLLERMVAGNDVALKRIQTAQRAASRGAELTRRLLAFSSKEELKPAPVLLGQSIQNTLELASRALGPEIRITTHIDPSVPAVFVDAAGLENALLNLAVNARDAMPRGGALIVSTSLRDLEATYPPVSAGELAPGTYACVSVSDTGHGMSPETLERAFEPFFTTKPRGKGTGLGLAMVYGFARQSGGTVRLYSEKEHGTTASIYLPLASELPAPAPAAVHGEGASRQAGTILLVDDEAALLEIAHAYLEDLGFAVIEAQDGPSALEAVTRWETIDLMITDVIMPGGMNGVDLAKRVRRLSPKTRIIFTSGFPAEALEERSGMLVDGPLLHKPYQRAEFAAMVRQTMEDAATGRHAAAKGAE